jgi:hypothetical protein
VKRQELPGQIALEIGPQGKPAKRAVPNGSKKPVWIKYTAVDPYRCDWCVLNQVEDRNAPVARKARYRRRVTGEGDLYLCLLHANDQRVLDGLTKFKR